MIYLLLASKEEHNSGLAIRVADIDGINPSAQQFDNSDIVQRINSVEVFAMQKGSKLGARLGDQKSALHAAHALLSAQPLLWQQEKLGSLEANIYLECDINTEIRGESGGLAYSLRLLEELTGYDIDGSQRFVDTHIALHEQVIGATGVIDVIGQINRVEGVEAKLKAFVYQLQKNWQEIQITTGQHPPHIVFLLPKANLEQLDSQVLKQAKKALSALSPSVDIVGIDKLAEVIKALVGNRFPVLQQNLSPYKGLNAFDPQDRLLFFGREKKVQDTLEKLSVYNIDETAHRHCIVFGDSGAGKSSFVKAGLLPQLSQQKHSTLQNWVILKPGDGQGQLLNHFIDSLRPTVTKNNHEKLLNLPWRIKPHEAVNGFADLYISARVESDTLTPDIYSDSPFSIPFVLVIDQAEELLRMLEVATDISQFKEVVLAFSCYHLINNLNIEQHDLVCWVISTIREAEYENYKSFLALENEKAQYFACPLAVLDPSEDIEAYQAIIENPARLRSIGVEPGLTQHLLSVITELKNPLPTLEYTLHELYLHAVETHSLNKGLTLAAFKDEQVIGSMSGLITRNAQVLLDELKKESGIRKRIPEFFSLLLGVDKTHILSYPKPAKIAAFKKSPELNRLYRAFVGHRFLLESDKNVRFSHEVLIREWEEVQSWAKKTAQREQNRKTRNLVVGLVFLLVLILIASYAAYYANTQSDRIKEERDNALITESRFLAKLSLEHTKSGNARLGALLALEALPDYSKKQYERRPFVPESYRSLYATLENYLDRLHLRHSDPVKYVAYSLDMKLIVTTVRLGKTAYVWNAVTGELVVELQGHTDWVNHASFSPDGKLIVTASSDNTARVWNSETGQLLTILNGHTDSISYATFSPDGKKIASASLDDTARLWKVETGHVVSILKGHTRPVDLVSFSLDGKIIVTASWDKTARVWNTETGQLLTVLNGHTDEVAYASFSPDGNQIVTASRDKIARVWNTETGQLLTVLKGHTDSVLHASFSPDGKKVITASRDNTGRVWDVETGQLLRVLNGHTSVVHHASYNSENQIVTASSDGTARVWNAHSGQLQNILGGHLLGLSDAFFSHDGKQIVTASSDKTVRVWSFEAGLLKSVRIGSLGLLSDVSLSPNGKQIFTASRSGSVHVWNAETGNSEAAIYLKGNNGFQAMFCRAFQVSFSPNGKQIVTTSLESKNACVSNVETGEIMLKLYGHTDPIVHATFSPSGKQIVTASYDKTARIWDIETERRYSCKAILKGHAGVVYYASFSPDGKLIVTTSSDRTARVWNAETGKLVTVLNGHTDSISYASFSPNSKQIVTASDDHTARVWNVETGKLLTVLSGHTGSVVYVSFSPNGKQIITTSDDNTARLWEVHSNQLLAVLNGHKNRVIRAFFRQDGQQIITVSWDTSMRLWTIYSVKELIEFVKSLDLPPLTPMERRQVFLD